METFPGAIAHRHNIHADFLCFLGVQVLLPLVYYPYFRWLIVSCLTNPIGFGMAFAYLRAARDEPVKVKDMFEGFRNYWNVVLASLLVGVIVVIGFVFLIVPGIIFACKLAFTPYLVVDRKMALIEAIQESWRMTGGHAWNIFLIGLLAIPICIAGLICFGVGIILAIMWVTLAFASLYHAVSSSSKASPQPECQLNPAK